MFREAREAGQARRGPAWQPRVRASCSGMSSTHSLRPCSCGGASFLRLDDAYIEVSCAGTSTPSTNPRFTLLVCEACGRTEIFTAPAAAAAHWANVGGRASRVHAAPAAPYR